MFIKTKFVGRKKEVHKYICSRGMSSRQEVQDKLNAMEQKTRAERERQKCGGQCPQDFNIDDEVARRRYHLGNVFHCGGIYSEIWEEFIPSEGWVSYVIEDVDTKHYSPQSEFHIAHSNYFFLEGKHIEYVSVTVEGTDRVFTIYKNRNKPNKSAWKTRL